MFIPLNQTSPNLRPSASQITPNDWEVLSRFWYPVAVEGDVKQAPVKGKLLDVDLVIYRVEGQVAVALDLCPHRHIRLSAGRIVGDRIVCAFHGLAFNAAGQCTKVPALGRDTNMPASYRLRTFRSEVRYGLVWACLDDHSPAQIPIFRAATEAGSDRLAFSLVRDWPVSAPRQVENFTDLAHIPFVHSKTLGGDPNARLTPTRVEHTHDGLILTTVYREQPEGGEAKDFTFTYRVTCGCAIFLRRSAPTRLGCFPSLSSTGRVRARNRKADPVMRLTSRTSRSSAIWRSPIFPSIRTGRSTSLSITSVSNTASACEPWDSGTEFKYGRTH
jgi:phenylpropionate dioxygenase-like ring-hydroxylating dioxygenase large terminal subunit